MIFGQGDFINAPSATPEEIERKRAAISAMMGQYGKAQYKGQGLGHLLTGIANGFASGRLNAQERKGRAEAQEVFDSLFAPRAPVEANVAPPSGSWSPFAQPEAPQPESRQSAFPASLIQTESGGNWNALNNEVGAGGARGHGGRLQFGTARLADAAKAGVIPAMTPRQFAQQPPEVQSQVENWHFSDIDQQTMQRGLDQFLGQEVGGIPITQDAVRAMAHLGGIGGAEKFLTSGGKYDPSDSFGTSLSEYARTHGGGAQRAPVSDYSSPTYPAYSGPSVQHLSAALANPWLTPTQKQVVGNMLTQAQQAADPMRQMQFQKAQQDLELGRIQIEKAMRPSAERTALIQNYEYMRSQGLSHDEALQAVRGGQTINVGGRGPQVGTIPQGYELFQNPESGGYQMRPIEGGPAATDEEAAQAAQAEKEQQTARSANIVLEDIDRALEQSDGFATTGWSGALADGIGGTPAHDLRNTLRTVQANIGFDRLQQMRDASPTGGALGAVSERELTELQAVLGSIQQTQSKDQLQRNLSRLRQVYVDILKKAAAYPNASEFGFEAPADATSGDGWITIDGVRIREKR